jgi:hypothetical protein
VRYRLAIFDFDGTLPSTGWRTPTGAIGSRPGTPTRSAAPAPAGWWRTSGCRPGRCRTSNRGDNRTRDTDRRDTRMRTLVQRLKRLWNTPVEFYGVDRPEPQAGSWHGLLLFVILLVVLGLLWLIRYLPERTYLV